MNGKNSFCRLRHRLQQLCDLTWILSSSDILWSEGGQDILWFCPRDVQRDELHSPVQLGEA